MKTIAITIEESMVGRLDDLAARATAGNRSEIVRRAVEEYLVRLERTSEEAREREIIRLHRARLRRQSAELVKAQAKP